MTRIFRAASMSPSDPCSSYATGPEDAAYTKRIDHRGRRVEPKLLAETDYRAKSAEGKVRHPVFKGIRDEL
jgi:hypothetical protein